MGAVTKAVAAVILMALSAQSCPGAAGVEDELVQRLRAAHSIGDVARVFLDASAAGVDPGVLARRLSEAKPGASTDAILLYLAKDGTDQIVTEFSSWTLGLPAVSGVEAIPPSWTTASERTARVLAKGGREWTLGNGDVRVAAVRALTAGWSAANDSAVVVIAASLVVAGGSDSDAAQVIDAIARSKVLRLQAVVEHALSIGSQGSTYRISRVLSMSPLIQGEWLESMLSSEAEFGRLFALVLLRERSPGVVRRRDFVARRLADPSEFVRAWAVEQLADTHPEIDARLQVLRAMALDTSSLVRLNVVGSLASLPAEGLAEARSLVSELADDRDEFVRLNVVFLLAGLGSKTPAERSLLRRLSRDRRPSVRREAAFAVLRGGDDDSDALAAVIDACADGRWDARSPQDWDRHNVSQAIRGLRAKTRIALREFAVHVARDGEGSRIGALRVLACMGSRGTLDGEWLRALQTSGSESERDIVRYLLGE